MSKKRHKNRTLFDSFNAAIEGFLYVVKTQRNMRIHFLAALLVVLLAVFLNFTRVELMILCLATVIVLLTEIVNTAIEIAFGNIRTKHDRWIKRIKDVSAGAVLVAAINALIVGYMLFFRDNLLHELFNRGLHKVSQSDWHISFLIFLVLISIVVMAKAIFHRGKPLRGGMPSGHAAVAFSIWMLVALISANSLLIFSVFILAFMLSQSRVSRNYHTVWEVFVGALIGITLTVLIYRLFAGVNI